MVVELSPILLERTVVDLEFPWWGREGTWRMKEETEFAKGRRDQDVSSEQPFFRRTIRRMTDIMYPHVDFSDAQDRRDGYANLG